MSNTLTPPGQPESTPQSNVPHGEIAADSTLDSTSKKSSNSSKLDSAFGQDLLASLVVFLVAVLLALGIALASGAPSVMPGLIACAVGGIVVGLLGGSRLQVSGPAAGLTVIVYGVIHKFGWPTACAISVVAGIFQVAFGSARIARACLAITPAVVHGMLAGIGVVIALSQIHIVLGGTPENSALSNLRELPGQIADLHGHSTILGLLTIAILFGWQYMPPKWRIIPGALIAVLVSTLVSNLEWFDVKRVDLPSNLGAAFALPQFPRADWGGFLAAALTIALVASVESLLCAMATDKLHNGPRANLDRELIGQGAGNIVSGLIGGLPITGVIVRSATNVNAGGQTRASAVLHGVWIIAFVALFSPLIERIPLATLAGLLVFVGIKLVNPRDIRELIHHHQGVIYFVTLFGVAFWNLLGGVGLGIGLSVLLLLRKLARTRVHVEQRNDRWHVMIEGSLTFTSVPQLSAHLGKIPAGATVDVDLMADFMDHAAFEALHGWRVTHEKLGGKVDIDERHENWYESAAAGKPLNPPAGKPDRFGATLKALMRKPRKRDIRDLAASAAEFNAAAPGIARPLFEKLAREGQRPPVLYIGCADSRVVPDLITNTEPGDLFTLRNIGNMMPPYEDVIAGSTDNSVLATLEYALNVLEIENIIVCGHSECGAMNALLNEGVGLEQQPGLRSWLRHGQQTMARFRKADVLGGSLSPLNQLAQINVIQQLDHLRAYPVVQRRMEMGRLHLWGWFFNIEEAQMYAYMPDARRFVTIDAEMAKSLLVPHAVGKAEMHSDDAIIAGNGLRSAEEPAPV